MAARRHAMADDATCVRCGLPYPWPTTDCPKKVRAGPRPMRRLRGRLDPVMMPEWRRVESDTRAALGTTPLSLDEIVARVLALRLPEVGVVARLERSVGCIICGAAFRTSHSRRKTCSEPCRAEAQRIKAAEYWARYRVRRESQRGRESSR